MRIVAHRIPAVLLVVVLFALPVQAWVTLPEQSVRIARPNAAIRSMTWTGSLQPDGTLAATAAYDIVGTQEFSWRVPPGAVEVTLNGTPVTLDPSGTFTYTVDGPVTVAYRQLGATRRYPDGVVVNLLALPTLISSSLPFDDLVVSGVLFHGIETATLEPGDPALNPPPSRLAVPPLRDVTVDLAPGVARFAGVGDPWDDVRVIAQLPPAAAPRAPTVDAPASVPAVTLPTTTTAPRLGGGGGEPPAVPDTATAAFDAALAALPAGAPAGVALVSADVPRLAGAVLLTVEAVLLAVWLAIRTVRLAGRRLAARAGVPGERSAPPDPTLTPDLVAVLVGDAGPGARSAVAATLVDLGVRRVIDLEALPGERFRVHIPAGAGQTGTTPAEQAVLTALRPQGQSGVDVELVGPPLWGSGPQPWLQIYGHDVRSRAVKRRLFTRAVPPAVLGPAAFAMGLTAFGASGGTNVWALVVALVGFPLGVVLAVASGYARTPAGWRARAEWLAFAEHLGRTAEFRGHGPGAVATYGPYLAWGTALGLAPDVAEALGVRRGTQLW